MAKTTKDKTNCLNIDPEQTSYWIRTIFLLLLTGLVVVAYYSCNIISTTNNNTDVINASVRVAAISLAHDRNGVGDVDDRTKNDDDEWTPDVIFGNYSLPITFDYYDYLFDFDNGTDSSSSSSSNRNKNDIQNSFDVGLMECYGFAFSEAQKIATKLISSSSYIDIGIGIHTSSTASSMYCPMCYWLLAMGSSPYINHPLLSNKSDYDNAARVAAIAFEEAHKTTITTTTTARATRKVKLSKLPKISLKELGLIDAMNVRFRSSFENQTIGYRAYKEKLQNLHETISSSTRSSSSSNNSSFEDDGIVSGYKQMGEEEGDVDVMAFLADAIMILYSNNDGYHFYHQKDDQIIPYPEIAYAITLLEDCLQQSPNHPLCQHLYIHITEPNDGIIHHHTKVSNVADRLRQGSYLSEAQHLQHMPSHTYLRMGRYHDAVVSNIIAHQSDAKYLNHGTRTTTPHTPYGPGHDLAFLIHAAQYSGERTIAYRYSNILRHHYRQYPTQPDGPGLEQGWHIWRTVRLRFGDFQSVLDDNDDIDIDIDVDEDVDDGVDNIINDNNSKSIKRMVGPEIIDTSAWPYADVLGHYSKGIATLWNNDIVSNNNNYEKITTTSTNQYDNNHDDDDRLSKALYHLHSLRAKIPNLDPSFHGIATIANLTLTSAIGYYCHKKQIMKVIHDNDNDNNNNNNDIDDIGRSILQPVEILELFKKARIEQESWAYTEPPSWYTTVALCEGTLLRIVGHYNDAVLTFQRDLELIPESIYGLYGLQKAMIAANVNANTTTTAGSKIRTYNATEIDDVSKRFHKASYWSDSNIRYNNSLSLLVCPELGE